MTTEKIVLRPGDSITFVSHDYAAGAITAITSNIEVEIDSYPLNKHVKCSANGTFVQYWVTEYKIERREDKQDDQQQKGA